MPVSNRSCFGNRLSILACAALAFAAVTPLYAAPFENLDFEQATLQPVDPGTPYSVYAAPALPGWTATLDTTVQNTVNVNFIALDFTAVNLLTPSITVPGWPSPLTGNPIHGNYTVQLSGVHVNLPGFFSTASISQTGDVPADAKSILFSVRAEPSASTAPNVSLDGITIDVFPVSTFKGVTLMAGDITPFAGTTRDLSFHAAGVHGPDLVSEDVYDLDDIAFSPLSLEALGVPEPASLSLLGVGGLVWLSGRRGGGGLAASSV
jgi:hypothetical protein